MLPMAAAFQGRWIFAVEIQVGMPGTPSAEGCRGKGEVFTLPSAQSIIWLRGNLARYIAVVRHHTGSPRQSTMAQKESMTRLRMRKLSALSTGGSFFLGAAEMAFSGAASSFGMPRPGPSLVDALMSLSRTGSTMELDHLNTENFVDQRQMQHWPSRASRK